jgi:phosphoribosylformimino-5-aminoimidazole carboxamide ribotide isomerase
MIAIPSLDFRGTALRPVGSPVRNGQPSDFARELLDLGFSRLQVAGQGSSAHDGARITLVEDIARDTNTRIQIQGVGTASEIEQWMRVGVDHVVLSARAIDEPEWLEDVSELYPEAVAVVTEVHDRRVVRRGWVRTLPVDILDLVDELNPLPLCELVVNVPAFDTASRNRELSLLEDVAERSRFPVYLSSGVVSLEDCRALEHRGLAGIVIDADRLLSGAEVREIAREFGG